MSSISAKIKEITDEYRGYPMSYETIRVITARLNDEFSDISVEFDVNISKDSEVKVQINVNKMTDEEYTLFLLKWA